MTSPPLSCDKETEVFVCDLQGLQDWINHLSCRRLKEFIMPEGTSTIFSKSEKYKDGKFIIVQG